MFPYVEHSPSRRVIGGEEEEEEEGDAAKIRINCQLWTLTSRSACASDWLAARSPELCHPIRARPRVHKCQLWAPVALSECVVA